MKFKLLFIIMLLTTSMSANAKSDNEDIGDYLEYASQVVSPGVKYFYISKTMISLSNGNVQGLKLDGKIRDKINFIRSVQINSNDTQSEKNLLQGANELATRIYKQYGYENLLISDKGDDRRFFLFGKQEKKNFKSLLIVVIKKEISPTTNQPEVTNASVTLMGGTFSNGDLQLWN